MIYKDLYDQKIVIEVNASLCELIFERRLCYINTTLVPNLSYYSGCWLCLQLQPNLRGYQRYIYNLESKPQPTYAIICVEFSYECLFPMHLI